MLDHNFCKKLTPHRISSVTTTTITERLRIRIVFHRTHSSVEQIFSVLIQCLREWITIPVKSTDYISARVFKGYHCKDLFFSKIAGCEFAAFIKNEYPADILKENWYGGSRRWFFCKILQFCYYIMAKFENFAVSIWVREDSILKQALYWIDSSLS